MCALHVQVSVSFVMKAGCFRLDVVLAVGNWDVWIQDLGYSCGLTHEI